MTVTALSFVEAFPEFREMSSGQLSFWLTQALRMVNPEAWGDETDLGVSLLFAHYLTLAKRNAKAAAAGGLPGQTSGPISSKQVGPVSQSYDTGAGTYDGEAFYNLTSYGVTFFSMVQVVGMGAIQVTGPRAGWPAFGIWNNGFPTFGTDGDGG